MTCLIIIAPCHRCTVVGNPGEGGRGPNLILFRGVLEVVRKSRGVGVHFFCLFCGGVASNFANVGGGGVTAF